VAVYTVIYYWFISKNWIYINSFGTLLTVVSAVGVWFLPESPKFYISRKRYDEARQAINFIAKVNKKDEFHSKFESEVLEEKNVRDKALNSSHLDFNLTSPGGRKITDDQATEADDNKTPLMKKKGEVEEHHLTGSLSDMIKIRRHFVNLIILIYLWVAASFNLYMSGFYMKYVSSNLFISTLISCLGDLPLSVAGGFTYHHLGPRRAMAIFLSVAIFGGISLSTWAT
jgi:Sugar (and other) transporter